MLSGQTSVEKAVVTSARPLVYRASTIKIAGAIIPHYINIWSISELRSGFLISIVVSILAMCDKARGLLSFVVIIIIIISSRAMRDDIDLASESELAHGALVLDMVREDTVVLGQSASTLGLEAILNQRRHLGA